MSDDRRGFVFTGISLLLAIPAVVLMASFISMLEYGDLGTETMIGGDSVFYTCDNLLDFLENGARDGSRAAVLANAASYADARGITFNSTELNTSLYQISVVFAGKIKCNRTIELRNGSLNVNLTLSNYATTQGGLPVYLRTGVNSLINTSTLVTFPSGNPASGANVTVITLGESHNNLTNSTGFTEKIFNISAIYDPSNDCSTKAVLGTQTAEATATMIEYYDGSDSESYQILGNISNANVEGYKPTKTTLGLKMTFKDEFGYPVSEYPSQDSGSPDLDCAGNYTAPFPSITARLYDTSVAAANLKSTWTSPTNISEEKQGATQWDGIFWTNDSGYAFTVANTYLAVVSISQPGFISKNVTKEVSFTDFQATAAVYGDGSGICKGSVGGPSGSNKEVIQLVITNVGTTDNTVWVNYTVAYSHTNSTNVFETLTYTYYPSGAKRGSSPWIICSNYIALAPSTFISANITAVGVPNVDVDLTNNYVNATA